MNEGFDFIGDIHGHADALEKLLEKMGYHPSGAAWAHPHKMAFFLGDLIDRGPRIRRTLELVRAMVSSGSARCLMGNHEYNALAWATPDSNGGYLRSHSFVHYAQHRQTLDAFIGHEAQWQNHLGWLRGLPLWAEGSLAGPTGESTPFRAVHAAWLPDRMATLARGYDPDRGCDIAFLTSTHDRSSPLSGALEDVLKGPEARLPPGMSIPDKEGHPRLRSRLKWWLPNDQETDTAGLFHVPEERLAELREAPLLHIPGFTRPGPGDPPVFFGHYWMRGEPRLLSARACCLDWSVAAGGVLCAYRWEGEQDLDPRHLIWVDP